MNELEQILTSLLDCRRIDLYVDKKSLTSKEKEKLSLVLKRRKEGEPLQYLLGFAEFMGLKIFVNPSVLIPRPETELLVETALEEIKLRQSQAPHILDIGTGSGNIAIVLAKHIPGAKITATDISKEALVTAGKNAEFHGVEKRILFVESDILRALRNNPRHGKLFDIIISNPPYIPTGNLETLPADVKREPRLALDGGKEGLNFYRRIIKEAPAFLAPGGLLVLEIGDGQKSAVETLLEKQGKFSLKDCRKDYRNIERILIGEFKGNG